METAGRQPIPPPSWQQEQDKRAPLVTSPRHHHPPSSPAFDPSRNIGHHDLKSASIQPPPLGSRSEKEGYDRYHPNHAQSMTTMAITALPDATGASAHRITSPVSAYPGPPPPYSWHPQPSSCSQNAHGPYQSPPESRRESREDRPGLDAHSRQALPSISEALARLPGIEMRHRAEDAQPSGPTSASINRVPSATHSDPRAQQTRGHFDAHESMPASYSPLPQRYDHTTQHHHRHQTASSSVRAPSPPLNGHHHRPSFSSSQNISPIDPSAPRTSPNLVQSYASAPQGSYYGSAITSPQQSSNPPLSARSATGSFPPAQTQASLPHQGHQSNTIARPSSTAPHPPQLAQQQQHRNSYGYSFPPPQTSGLTYEQSLQQAAHTQNQHQRSWQPNPEFEKVEEQRRAAAMSQAEQRSAGASYAVTVKRHLDDFDVENNLNDLAERTGRIMDFSKTYGAKAHQYPRETIPAAELPDLDVCDRMIDEAIALKAALERLRRVVDQQNRLAEQTAAQQNLSGKAGAEASGSFGPDGATSSSQLSTSDKGLGKLDLASGGFAGGDSKKRRGRNAPPGRCHSCNRVETPEWRRGPDGARTLCNACGLHYAKLTKKLNSSKESKASTDVTMNDLS